MNRHRFLTIALRLHRLCDWGSTIILDSQFCLWGQAHPWEIVSKNDNLSFLTV